MFSLTYLMIIVLIIGHIQIFIAADCGPNEKKVDCAQDISCQPACDQPKGGVCPRDCGFNSCECKDGYIRTTKNNSTCIPKAQCPIICGENEQYDKCANPCQPSCSQPNRQPCPTFTCSKGCICQGGYLRATNDANSSCIKCDINNSI